MKREKKNQFALNIQRRRNVKNWTLYFHLAGMWSNIVCNDNLLGGRAKNILSETKKHINIRKISKTSLRLSKCLICFTQPHVKTDIAAWIQEKQCKNILEKNITNIYAVYSKMRILTAKNW